MDDIEVLLQDVLTDETLPECSGLPSEEKLESIDYVIRQRLMQEYIE